MLDRDMCNAIYKLHEQGMPLREMTRRLGISRNTIRRVIRAGGQPQQGTRRDRIAVDPELLQRLYRQCDGWVQRIHEKLLEEEVVKIGYSTLTRLLRESGIGQSESTRCDRVPDEPGLEMQHDTTVYQVPLDGRRTRLVASLLYLRYSKRRYLKFYRVFDRFAMKCFLHEALTFWGYSAKQCIIDNTNLARLRGSGSSAVIAPEMEAFSRQYGFRFLCHELQHANRKAGEERSFWTVETNFLPGRTFQDLADLNEQAHQWATSRMEHRAQGKTRLIPAKAFEHEMAFLNRLTDATAAPYRTHERVVDQYGYVAFGANYYWVPGNLRGRVKVLQYSGHIKIFDKGELTAEYRLPAEDVKQQRFSPSGEPQPRFQPNNRHRDSAQEAQRLRDMGADVAAYLDFATQVPGIQRHQFTRGLLELSTKVTSEVFLNTVRRALRYHIAKLETVRRIAWWCLHELNQPVPQAEIDQAYRDREAFREGYITEPPDLSVYDRRHDENHDENRGNSDDER